MSAAVIIVMGEREADPLLCEAVPAGGDHPVQREFDRLTDIPADWLAGADAVWVVVPGAHSLARAVELPARTEAQARAALPFLLEDDLASDPENLHFALGRFLADKRRLVGAVDRRRMTGWMAALDEAGIEPTRLVPDFLALPAGPNTATIVERDGQICVRLGDEGGFTIETDLVGAVLPEMLTASNIETLEIHGETVEAPLPSEIFPGRAVDQRPKPDGAGLCGLYRSGLSGGAPLDFLQGPFARRRHWDIDSGKLRIAASAAGLLGVAWLALLVSEGWRYERLADRAFAQSEALFREAFPEVDRVVNPRAQLQSRLAQLRGGDTDSFVRLSNILFSAIGRFEAVEVESLRFDQGRNALSADLVYPNFADMERIRQAIAEQGGVLEEGASRQRGTRIVGDVTIRMAQ